LRRAFSVGESHFNLPQQRHDLLRLVFPDRHTSFPPESILSHSRWYKKSRSAQSYDLAHGLIVIDYQDLSHDFADSP
jgi:hypothetical protein